MRLGIGIGVCSVRAAGGAFTPASLFASGEEGVWYEPSPTTTFASTANLTPCADGDTCGFLLDESQGAGYSGGNFTGLGTEQAPALNTYVISGTGTWVSVSGGYEFTDTVGGQTRPGVAWASSTITNGNTYLVEVEIQSIAGASQVRIDRSGSAGDVLAVVGTTTFVTTADSTMATQGLRFRIEDVSTAINDGFVVNTVSVKEIPGNHATQGTLASRPILRQTGGGVYYLDDDEVDDAINWTAPAGTYTIAYVNTSGTVTTLTGQSLSGATNILLDPALVAYVAVDRALTGAETSGLQSYLAGLAS